MDLRHWNMKALFFPELAAAYSELVDDRVRYSVFQN